MKTPLINRAGRLTSLGLALGLSVLGLSACAAPAANPTSPPPATGDSVTPTANLAPTDLTVLAAASLTAVFTAIGHDFESAHPGVTVHLSFDGSATLVTQISQGAPADIVALADNTSMDKLVQAGLIAGTAITFASNNLVLAVPADNPAGVTSLADLLKPDVKTITCAAEVPCGAAAQRVFAAAGVSVTPVSLESSVTAVVTKLTLGEADAGLVYATDVAGANGQLLTVALPDDPAVTQAGQTTYPIAVVATTAQTGLANQFIDFVTTGAGQTRLQSAGFGPPGT